MKGDRLFQDQIAIRIWNQYLKRLARSIHGAFFTMTVLIGAVSLHAEAASPPDSPVTVMSREDVARFVDDFMLRKMTEYQIPGLTFVVVKDGGILFCKGYGYADVERKTPVDPGTHIFNLASISKSFVATAVMQLAEQGRISLHEDVNTYLKAIKLPNDGFGPVTFHDLLTHTSGFDEVPNSSTDKAEAYIPLEKFMLLRAFPRRIRPPGQVEQYSNYGFDLLGYLVQEISGEPFPRYQENHIFKPLGMEHSSFEQVLPVRLTANLVKRFRYRDGRYVVRPPELINEMPAGGLTSTAVDIAAFMVAHLQDGRWADTRILKEQTARLMHETHFSPYPGLDGVAYGFFVTRQNGQRILIHDGDGPGMHPRMALLPGANAGFFFATNGGGAFALKVRVEFLKAFVDRFFPAPKLGPPRQAHAAAATTAGKVAGYYRPTIYDHRGLNKLLSSQMGLLVMKVAQKGDGIEISAPFGLGSAVYTETSSGFFQQTDGAENYAAFSMDGTGRPAYLHCRLLDMTISSERLSWYEWPVVVLALLLLCAMVFALTVVVWPIYRLVVFLRRSGSRTDQGSAMLPWFGSVFGIAAMMELFFLQPDGFDPMVSRFQIVAMHGLSWLAVVFLVAAIVTICRRRPEQPRNRFMKVCVVFQSLAGLSFIWEAWYWNWLG